MALSSKKSLWKLLKSTMLNNKYMVYTFFLLLLSWLELIILAILVIKLLCMILIFTKILNNLYKLTKYYTLFKECYPCNICFSLDKKLTMSAAKRESEDDLSELSWNKIDLSNGISSP